MAVWPIVDDELGFVDHVFFGALVNPGRRHELSKNAVTTNLLCQRNSAIEALVSLEELPHGPTYDSVAPLFCLFPRAVFLLSGGVREAGPETSTEQDQALRTPAARRPP